MSLVTGYLLLVIIILLCLKFITKRMGNKKLDNFFMRMHKPIAYIGLLLVIVHLITTWKVLETRPLFLYIGGILIVIIGIVSGVSIKFVKKLKGRWIILHRVLALCAIALVACHMILYFVSYSSYLNRIDAIKVADIDVSSISDGQYIGSYDVGYINAKVKVIVERGRIADIKILEHNNERGKRAEVITQSITKQNKITVDTISGATNSSKVLQSAVMNALMNKGR